MWVDSSTVETVRRVRATEELVTGRKVTTREVINAAVAAYVREKYPALAINGGSPASVDTLTAKE